VSRGLLPADFLLPAKQDMSKWSVIACDQFTSEPGYWARVEETVGKNPSTLHTILPEVYLEADDTEARISQLKETMHQYLEESLFESYSGFVFVERRLSNNVIRRGIVGLIDLEEYSFESDSDTPIRSTEQTVIERIPPRLSIRNGSPLEFSHVIMLFDDVQNTVIAPIEQRKSSFELLYDFDLMESGGHITGWLLDEKESERVQSAFISLSENSQVLFAVGDGNHSLAAAKSNYELLKEQVGEDAYLNHPARYALVEAINLYEPAMEFEAIHRIVFDTDVNDLLTRMNAFFNEQTTNNIDSSLKYTLNFQYVINGKSESVSFSSTQYSLPVAALQHFLDGYISETDGKIDYIHGDSTLVNLTSENQNSIGFLLPPIDKSTFFSDILKNGTFPRKTFSCGAAEDKRYYLECRKIL